MFWDRKTQPKEEHPATMHPEMQQVDIVTAAVDECCASLERIHNMLNPPQAGSAIIPPTGLGGAVPDRVPWSDLPISPLTGFAYDPDLIGETYR